MSVPDDYLHRVYAGVLGKLIGVYLGRPFENWTNERILKSLGPIEYYVHDRLHVPLIVTDDDIAGTFTFLRALEDFGVSEDLTSEDIGKAWLNYIVEKRTILWWGGNGNSTEHTAWLNLKRGIPAPLSGATETNGQTVAEQIGAQIFIDGWAMVAPGKPALAAKLAQQAARVSHDGDAVHAAMLWASMEAAAFGSNDVDHLLDTGLAQIPPDCAVARLIGQVRTWHKDLPDWRDCRQRIADNHGYDRYPGHCHVMPNHALMIMALLYAPDDFAFGQKIVNTSGWDTDCNAGNLGCLQGIMLGLEGLNAGPDWRGPVADRMLVSSADGGNAINDAVRTAYRVANLGLQLDGRAPLIAPKGGAQFHFSLPGAVQGFQVVQGNGSVKHHAGALRIESGRGFVLTTTPTFAPPEVVDMPVYELMACPLVYPGQTVTAEVKAAPDNSASVQIGLHLRHYGKDDALTDHPGPSRSVAPGETVRLAWALPDTGGQPIAELGLRVAGKGVVFLDRMGWTGSPCVTLRKPDTGGSFWRRAWVNGVDTFSKVFPQSFHISQDRGEGVLLHGTRDWTDYSLETELAVHLGRHAGVVVRAQGMRRYYAARITRQGRFELVCQYDDLCDVLASAEWPFVFDMAVPIRVVVRGSHIEARAGTTVLNATDTRLADGAIGLMIAEGAASTWEVRVGPA